MRRFLAAFVLWFLVIASYSPSSSYRLDAAPVGPFKSREACVRAGDFWLNAMKRKFGPGLKNLTATCVADT